MEQLKFISLNAANNLVLGGLLSILKIENPDIVFLQEITLTSGQLKLFVAKYGYSAEANTDLMDITKLGTGILWKSELPVTEVISVVECRAQLAKLGKYNLVNLYAPSGSNNKQGRRDLFGQDLFHLIRGLSSSPYPLLGGDFNCVLSPLDTEKNFSEKKCPALKDLVDSFNYMDAFRSVKPNTAEFTFHRPKCAASRLDRFYVPQQWIPHIQQVSHHASLSDHHYVVLILDLPDIQLQKPAPRSSPLYWKLNTSVLKDEDFLDNFQTFYTKLQRKITDFCDIADWWDLLAKPAIKEFCMSVSERLAYVRKNTKSFLFSYLTLVIRKGNWREATRVRRELRNLLLKESMGVIVRSRHKENLETEKASLFFQNRENKKFKQCSLHELKINGQITSDKKTIEDSVLKYFGALFNGHHDKNGQDTGQAFKPNFAALPEFLEGLGCLSQESREALIKKLSLEEIKHIVLKECDANKSPGLDGLPYEFYQVTWDIIGEDFVDVLQIQLQRLSLIDSDTHGATRLCSKVDGVPGVSELRPITLLNCDYKILSKVFVKRMCPVMCEIILSGQLCSVQGKNILFGAGNIISTIDYINAHLVPAFMVSLDMFKAYDRVMLLYLMRVMKAMKFPDIFINWIKMLHEGATTCFLLSFLTQPIKVLFSIRQGDPLSMMLYIIYIEPLLLMINKRTHGIYISSFVQKDDDYCDDLNFISESENDLLVIEEVFVKFEEISGAILSRSRKSKIMGLGPWRNRREWSLPWLKVESELKVFGFQITPTYKNTLERSWAECFLGFHKVLMSWSSRQLETLVQRVEVLRLFLTSKLWYKASVLPLPVKFAKKFETAMFRFIWRGKFEKLKMDEIKNPVLSGGLNLPCILSRADSLFLSQTCKLLRDPESKQYCHVKYWIGLYMGEHFPDMSSGPHAELISPYFQHMKALLSGALLLGDVEPRKLKEVTAKKLYLGFTTSFPPPKVVYKFEADWEQVWMRLQSPVLGLVGRELLFMVIHNIMNNRDRMFKFNMVNSPNCPACRVRQDNVHLFCECLSIREAWFWLRQRFLAMLPPEYCQTSNFEFINLMFQPSTADSEIVWLLSVYMELVWDSVICIKKNLKLLTVKTQCALQYEIHQKSKKPALGHIVGLFQ